MPSSRFWFPGSPLLSHSSPLTLVDSLLSYLVSFHRAHENSRSSVFSFFSSPEAYAIAFLFYFILRLFLDLFCLLATPQRSAVFSLTPSTSESRFPPLLALYIYSLDNSLEIVFLFLSFPLFSLLPPARPHCTSTSSCHRYLNGLELHFVPRLLPRSWPVGTFFTGV